MSVFKIGALFAGYGGLDMAVASVLDARMAWCAEFDTAPSRILAYRYPDAPNLGDVTKIDWSAVEPVDIITGGSPCQDLSQAGKRAGMKAGTRSGLWASMCDAIEIIRPRLVVWENVRGALSAKADAGDMESCEFCVGNDGKPHLRALGRVLGDLAELGYDAAWTGIRAADVGAPHGRWRVFVLAWPADDTDRDRRDSDASFTSAERARQDDASGASADPALTLLPPPAASTRDVVYARKDYHHNLSEWAGHFEAGTLEATTSRKLLPTPTAVTRDRSPEEIKRRWLDGERGSRGRNLDDMTAHVHWGDYASAIARWEAALGRPAPAPTQPSETGRPRLSPRFVEWMMGLPDGWVTDPAIGITRKAQLKALGNGVVPQQAAAALRHLLSIRAQVITGENVDTRTWDRATHPVEAQMSVVASKSHENPAAGPVCAHGCGMPTKGGKYLPGHDAKHVANLAADIACGARTPADAFPELATSPNLHNKLAQRLHKMGWTFDADTRTWTRA